MCKVLYQHVSTHAYQKAKYKVKRSTTTSSKSTTNTSDKEDDSEGKPYHQKSPNLWMSEAHKLQLNQLECKKGRFSATQLERQQELLNMEAIQSSLSATDEDSEDLVIDENEINTPIKRPLIKTPQTSPKAKKKRKKNKKK